MWVCMNVSGMHVNVCIVGRQGRESLEESLAKFTADEHMAGENQLVCESCAKVTRVPCGESGGGG